MDIVNREIEKYLEDLSARRDPIFHRLEERARAENFPAVGPGVGALLELLARFGNARRILELGSGFGYSGLWFARALPADGKIVLTDFEESNRQRAQDNFKEAGLSHLVEFMVGDALALMAGLDPPFDIIFNDIDKELYPEVVDPVYGLLRVGGLFISDNTLWYGKVAEDIDDAPTRAVREFNRKIKDHRGFLTVQLPLRDGLGLCLKVK